MFTGRLAWGRALGLVTLLAVPAATSGGTIWHVNGSLATGNDDGTSWTDAFRSAVGEVTPLRRAIAAAQAEDEIWVARGTYKPAVQDRAASFYLKTGVKIFGGFTGNPCETLRCYRDHRRNVTILSGDLAGNDADPPSFATYADNSCSVVRVIGQDADLSHTVLDGFTIIGGNAEGDQTYSCATNNDVVSGCQDDQVDGGGGAVRFECGGKGTVSNCPMIFNRANWDGGAVFAPYNFSVSVTDPQVRIVNCVIARNWAAGSGGGIGLTKDLGGLELYNSRIIANEANVFGGGVSLDGTGPKYVVNCVVAHNCTAGGTGVSGGGVHTAGGPCTISNTTVAFNDAGSSPGGGIAAHGQVELNNAVVWGNVAGQDPQQLYRTGNTFNVRHTDVLQATPQQVSGTINFVVGNLQSDPVFPADPTGDGNPLTWWDNDYSVQAGSPVFDRANNSLVESDRPDIDRNGDDTELVPLDLGFNSRFVDVAGATDCSSNPPASNCGTAPIADMGAYEGAACLSATVCNDFYWCTLDDCTTLQCRNECIPGRKFGDVKLSSAVSCISVVDIEDITAVADCFSSACSNCGYPGSGTKSNCDLLTATGNGAPNGIVYMDDILAVMAAFGGNYRCQSPCLCNVLECAELQGESSAAPEPERHLEAAAEIIDYLAGAASATDEDLNALFILGDAFVLWCDEFCTNAERGGVVELLQAASEAATAEVNADLLADVAGALGD